MRIFFILISLSFLIVNTAAPAGAAFSLGAQNNINELHGTGSFKNNTSLSYWFVDGYFEMEGGPPAASNRWIIEHPMDGRALLLATEFRPTARLFYDIAIGTGSIDDGRVTDTDIDAGGVVSNLSYSTGSGYWSLFGTNLYIRAYSTRSTSIDFSVGYLYLKSIVDYYDPNFKVVNYAASTVSWQERWLTYDLAHQGIRFGVRGESKLNKSFLVKGAFGVIPWLKADYDGLRYPERPLAQQQIEAIEADGLGLDALISAEYNLYGRFALTLGYRYLSFKTEGEDRAGTPWAGSWEELSMELKGPFLALGFNF